MHQHGKNFEAAGITANIATIIRTNTSAGAGASSITAAAATDNVVGAGDEVSHLQPLVLEVPLEARGAAGAHGPAHLGRGGGNAGEGGGAGLG